MPQKTCGIVPSATETVKPCNLEIPRYCPKLAQSTAVVALKRSIQGKNRSKAGLASVYERLGEVFKDWLKLGVLVQWLARRCNMRRNFQSLRR